jgi:hypothetical protein
VPATLSANDTVRYELDLPARHFVAGRIDQDGVDATVTVTTSHAARAQAVHLTAAKGRMRGALHLPQAP